MSRRFLWRRGVLVTAALVTALSTARPASALDPSRRLTQYTVETWGTEDGLPSMAIAAAVQTPDGDLWLGTGDGLVRFDGVRFEAFDRRTPGLRGTEVRALHVDGQGRLWIGFAFGGISRREGGGFVAAGPEDLVIASFADGPDGLLAGTATGIVRVAEGAVEPYAPAASLPVISSRLMRDRAGRIWVSGPNSLYALDRRGVLFRDQGGDALAAASVGIDAPGDAVRWRSGRLERWTGDRFDAVPGFALPPSVDPPQLYSADRAGAVWLAFGQNTGVGRWLDGRVEALPASHPAVAGRFAPLGEDREGNLWLGSWTRGLMRLSDGPLTTWSSEEGLPGDTVRALHEAADGAIWAGTIHGLARLPRGGEPAQVFAVPDDGRGFMQSDFIYSLAPLADGALAVGTQRGLFRFADNRIEPWLPGGRVFPRQVFSLTSARDGSLWIGSAVGDVPLPGEGSPLVRLVAGRAEEVPIPAVIVFQTLEDRRGHIWASTSNGVFEIPSDLTPRLHPIPGMTAQPYYLASTEDSRGDLWFATIQDGIVRVRDGEMRRLGRADGLPDDGFTALVDDGLGHLWLGSSKGLLRIALTDLDAKLADPSAPLPYRRFDRDDGLKSPSIEGGNDGNVLRARDGRLWFATLAGAAVVDPGRLPPVARPAARVERVLVDGKVVPGAGEVRLAPGRYRLELELSAIHMRAPKRLRFRHRLSGVDADWIDAGSRRFASYPLVPPGERTFAVEASVDGETWGPAAELAVVIAPHWWQRTWFLVVAPLAFVGLGLAAQRARVARLRRRAQELERLVDFGRGVTGILDPDEIGQQLLRALAVRFGEGPRLLVALRDGRPAWMVAAGWSGPVPRPAVSYEGLAGRRRPFVLGDAKDLAPWFAELRAAGLGLVAPLISGETTFGLIGVAGERAKEADLAQLGALAAQVTMALEGAWQAQEAVRWQHVSEARREWLETDLVARLVFAAVVRIGGDATRANVTGALVAATGEDAVLTPTRVAEALGRLIDRGAVATGADGTLRVARDRWLLLPEIRQPLAEIARQAVLRLGAYRLGERIGGGGMGEVFRGVNVHDGSLAAVKVLFPHQTVDAEARRRLAREGELVATIRHPNVVRLLERGEHDGRLYLAMELLGGETLAVRLQRDGALGVDEAVRAGRQLASALAALHAHDVVHRDLTAANVMCERDDRYVLLDFGLARGLDSSTVTRGQAVLGTLLYMSPEQLRGEDVDARTDLWSLGVVLHEMATGMLPWEAAVTVRMALEILGEARPALRRLDGLPPAFAALVAALLEPDRARRLPDAGEAERRLAAVATGDRLG